MQKFFTLAIISMLAAGGRPPQLDQADMVLANIIYGQQVAKEKLLVEPALARLYVLDEGHSAFATGVSVADAQASFLDEYGYYWQGVSPTSEIPISGNPLPVDPTVHPSDSDFSWATIGISLPEEMDVAVRVDSYLCPDGPGYIVAGDVFVNGNHWRKVENFGPETWRSTDWITVTDWIIP